MVYHNPQSTKVLVTAHFKVVIPTLTFPLAVPPRCCALCGRCHYHAAFRLGFMENFTVNHGHPLGPWKFVFAPFLEPWQKCSSYLQRKKKSSKGVLYKKKLEVDLLNQKHPSKVLFGQKKIGPVIPPPVVMVEWVPAMPGASNLYTKSRVFTFGWITLATTSALGSWWARKRWYKYITQSMYR